MTDTTTDQNTTESTETATETIDARPLSDLTGFQRDLLYTILNGSEEENYGLGIKQRLEADYGWDDDETEQVIHNTQLYRGLDNLTDKGLVERGEIDRRTNSYALTERGRVCVQTHCDWVVEKATGGDE